MREGRGTERQWEREREGKGRRERAKEGERGERKEREGKGRREREGERGEEGKEEARKDGKVEVFMKANCTISDHKHIIQSIWQCPFPYLYSKHLRTCTPSFELVVPLVLEWNELINLLSSEILTVTCFSIEYH